MCEDWISLEFLNVHSPAYLPNDFGKKKKKVRYSLQIIVHQSY
jgi:hypothetical protein